MNPPWQQDKNAYKALLECLGYNGKSLDFQLLKMELKEAYSLSLLTDKPVEPRVKDGTDIQIDHAWIEGETCSPIFDRLSPAERYVLYVLYNEERPADFLGLTQESFRRTIREIRRKLANDTGDSFQT